MRQLSESELGSPSGESSSSVASIIAVTRADATAAITAEPRQSSAWQFFVPTLGSTTSKLESLSYFAPSLV